MFLLSKVNRENFSLNVFIKKYDWSTFQLSLAINSPEDALSSGQVLRAWLPSAVLTAVHCKNQVRAFSPCLAHPFPVSMWEGEKCLLLLLAASSNEGGSGSRVQVSISKASKLRIHLEKCRCTFCQWDPGAHTSWGTLGSALVSRDGQLRGDHKKATAKRSSQGSSSGIEQQEQGEWSQTTTQKSSLQFQSLCGLWCHLFQVTSLCH